MEMNPGQQQRPANGAVSGLSGLIRPEQVGRLPQLNQSQKQQFGTVVTRLWEIMNQINNPADAKYQQAHAKLIQTSTQLMTGMKNFRAMQQQAQAQAQAAAAGANQAQTNQQAQQAQQVQAQAQQQNGAGVQNPGNSMSFGQLLPEIQSKVNEQHFFFPPGTVEGTKPAEDWLREAKARYGQALQRAHMARSKKLELQRTATQRSSNGNPLTAQENDVFQSKLAQCLKAISESQSFMERFKEQQTAFQRQQQQQQPKLANAGVNGNTGTAPSEGATDQAATPTVAAATNNNAAQGAPNAYSITSAVNAARNAAQLAAQNAGSPTHPQSAGPGATPTIQNPMNTAQSPIHATSGADHSRPGSAHPGQGVHPQNLQSQSTTPHAHPLNAVNGIKSQGPAITKDLRVAEPKPVQMPPSRPTLNGGAGVGLPGQIAQPALTALPGYVLESSEDGRVLSKKKLRELFREVCGANPEEQLSPEAEEILLQSCDDFVDDLISLSCKLAKLRGSQHLEPRDILVVLERHWNIRVPGYSTDEVRTVRRPQPAPGWAHKMSAVQAAKLTGGGSAGQALGTTALGKD